MCVWLRDGVSVCGCACVCGCVFAAGRQSGSVCMRYSVYSVKVPPQTWLVSYSNGEQRLQAGTQKSLFCHHLPPPKNHTHTHTHTLQTRERERETHQEAVSTLESVE